VRLSYYGNYCLVWGTREMNKNKNPETHRGDYLLDLGVDEKEI
jgi:hypothetical protein